MRTVPAFALCCMLGAALSAAEYKAGIAKIRITPQIPIWMAGFAARNHPSDGVLHDLWAKALAVEDPSGLRVVIVTTDLLGLPRGLAELVAARVQKEYGIERPRLLLNSSHTHSGPVLHGHLPFTYDLTPEQAKAVEDYSAQLPDRLVTVVGAALADLKPAALAYGHGQAHFGINRRERIPGGYKIGVNPEGPSDPEVPVLKVTAPDGTLRAALFGYACHNTSLTAEFYQISGDYAGFAQIEFEKRHPGATAMFMELCGGDQTAHPRSKLELAQRYGKDLATEVDRVISGTMRKLRPPLRAAFQVIELKLADYDRQTLEERLKSPTPAFVRNAQAMLKAWDERRPVRRVPYPVQALRFGKDLTIVALGGEVVVDYALRVKKESRTTREPIFVAGYSNDVMSYIPSLRVLKEGGYEAFESSLYYGLPAPYNEEVEDDVFGSIRNVLKRVGRTR
jgi:neutral ceramidase